ncbi:DUF3923 family protein [Pediococcus ethanolidurans]|uniref:DUF3923 family protein n=1 Tax=Pediococcus ethanolidurans TaxID=319653 RepID=UPI002954194C|nr:DUF3923 family protein [Pediococcus ethanolidurans]MDV7718449.1 DUF3923 family protein [Pediococcus ethanolidurans]
MQIRSWWIINVIWLAVFLITTIFILIRKVDGAGVVQTMPAKGIALAVLGIFFILVLICQLIVYFVIRKRQ